VRGVGAQPAPNSHLDERRWGEREQGAAERGGVSRQSCGSGETGDRVVAGLFLDVRDLQFVQHAQAGAAASVGGQVLQHAGCAFVQGGGAVGALGRPVTRRALLLQNVVAAGSVPIMINCLRRLWRRAFPRYRVACPACGAASNFWASQQTSLSARPAARSPSRATHTRRSPRPPPIVLHSIAS